MDWRRRFESVGWALLPLRGFLGVTFVYAGIQKLADPRFLSSGDPASIGAQMASYAPQSPIGPLLDLAARAPLAVGLMIAIGELAVGAGALVGWKTRWAAAGGALLSLAFLLTVSWHTNPYYYGPDVISMFAWTPLMLAGDGGVLSFETWIQSRAGRPESADPGRRRFLREAAGTAVVAAATLLAGGIAAAVGRASGLGSTPGRPDLGGAAATTTPPGGPGPDGAVAVGDASVVPAGSAASFVDPISHQPGVVFRTRDDAYLAHSAVCTHSGCRVGFDGTEYLCPCHGARFDPVTGDVIVGPARRPLPEIPVTVGSDGKLYVSA
jgi:thiosulfate dehydrogenase [quinone] large subunit